MIVRSTRLALIYVLEAIAVLAVLMMFIAGVVLWRLAQGPISLDFLIEDAQIRLADAFDGDLVSLASLETRFETDSGLLIFTARDVTVAEVGGEVITRAPIIEAGFGLDALLSGAIAPTRVNIEGGTVSIVRRDDGAVGAGLGLPQHIATQARPTQSSQDVEAILELLRNPDDSAILGRLREVRIHSTSLRVVDEVNRISWIIDRTRLSLERDQDRLIAEISGRFATTSGFAPVAIRLEAGADLNSFLLEAQAQNLSPRAIAPLDGPLGFLGQISAPVSLEVFANATRQDGIRAASLNLELGAGQIGRGDGARLIEAARARVDYEPQTGTLLIPEASMNSELLTTQLSGRIYDMREFADAFPRQWDYELLVEEGRLDLGGVFEQPPEWGRIELAGEMNLTQRRITFDRLIADIDTIRANLSGEAGFRQVEDGRWLPDVRLVGPVEGDVAPETVLRFWPVDLADGARSWIRDAIISARLFDAYLELDLNAEALVEQRLDNDRMALSFSFEDAAFRYISTMTPVTQANGRATLFGNAFTVEMDTGYIGETEVRNGFVDIPRLNPRGALARFGGNARAEAQNVLALIDEPPLNLVTDYGLDATSITGHGEITFEILRPMLTEVAVEDVGFDIRADFEDVTFDAGIRSIVLEDGDVTVIARPDLLDIQGQAQFFGSQTGIRWREYIGRPESEPSTEFDLQTRLSAAAMDQLGVPLRRYIEGEIAVRVNMLGEAFDVSSLSVEADLKDARIDLGTSFYVKEFGEEANASLNLRLLESGDFELGRLQVEGRGLSLEGAAIIGPDGRLLSAEIDRAFLDGFISASLRAERVGNPTGPLNLTVDGEFLDATEIVPQLADFSGEGGPPPPIGLNVSFDEVVIDDGVTYRDILLGWSSNANGSEALSFTANTSSGVFLVEMDSNRGSRRELLLETPDFGELLRALDVYENVEGGRLTLTGSTPPAGQDGISEYQLVSEGFILTRMPVLARILAAGSLPGLASLLSGEGGISFEQLNANLQLEDGVVTLTDVQANGPSLGVTVSGRLDMERDVLGLDGVLAPSYGLNSFVGNIPLVGDALISRPGEGVIGLTFSVEGPFAQPTIITNPLSILAPGVFRRLFEGRSGERVNSSENADEAVQTPYLQPNP